MLVRRRHVDCMSGFRASHGGPLDPAGEHTVKKRQAGCTVFHVIVCLCVPSASALSSHAQTSPLPLVTTASEIRNMSRAEANRGYPVRLKGVITYYDPQTPDLFLQDKRAGIWLDIENWDIHVKVASGAVVEVEGVTEQPDFAPQVGKPRVKILGRAPLPEPKHLPFRMLSFTMADSLRVEVEGIIQRVWKDKNLLVMDVAVDGGHVSGRIPFFTGPAPENLVSARVRMRGTCGAIFNTSYQLIGVFVEVPYLAEMQILEPAPADPFAAPLKPLQDSDAL